MPGLHTVYDGSASTKPSAEVNGESSDAEIDVIAVHGLNFRNRQNHAFETWTSADFLWIRDALPAALPQPCRVMAFEYNSSPAMGSAGIKLDDHAKTLLHWLRIKRKEAPKRPLVFLCHSLGGLIVKQALIEAALDKTHKDVLDSTYLLSFFATPHQGGNHASFGDVVGKIVRTTLGKPNNDLVKSLKRESNETARRFEQFRHLGEKYSVLSFYEGQPYGRLGIIVDKKSATLNLPGTREKQIHVDADHSAICKFATADDPTCVLVIQTIATELEEALQLNAPEEKNISKNVHWYLPRPVNPLFIGRTQLLSSITTAIRPVEKTPDHCRTFVITGLGGQGKSELCLKVANKVRDLFWGVFWIDVSNETTTKSSFLKISEILQSPADTIDDVRHVLSNVKQNWLMVLDNADDPKFDYATYLPSSSRGTVLITSRVPECSRYATIGSAALGNLSDAECTALLLQAAGVAEESYSQCSAAASRIVKTVGSHTLALIQAGSYIAQRFCSLEEYPTVYERESERLLKHSDIQLQSRYRTVYATFEASAQILASSGNEESQDALELLHVFSGFHYNDIPIKIFEDAWKGAQVAKMVQNQTWDIVQLDFRHFKLTPRLIQAEGDDWNPLRSQKALNLLSSLALIKQEQRGDMSVASMHPLIHKWATARQDFEQKNTAWLAVGCILSLSKSVGDRYPPYMSLLNTHIPFFLSRETTIHYDSSLQEVIATVFYWCANTLIALSSAELAYRLVQRTFSILNADPLSPVENLIDLYVTYINTQSLTDRGEEAIASCKELVNLAIVGLPTWSLGEAKLLLAMIYVENDHVEDALEMFDDFFNSSEEILDSSPYYSRLCQLRATAYYRTNRISDAILSFEVALSKAREEDRYIEDLLFHMAICYLKAGKAEMAIPLVEEAMKLGESLPDEHLDRLHFQFLLGEAYVETGKIQEGLCLMEHVAKVSKDTFAEDNMDRKTWDLELARYHELHSSQKGKRDKVDIPSQVTTFIGKEADDFSIEEKSLGTAKGATARKLSRPKRHFRTISRLFGWQKALR